MKKIFAKQLLLFTIIFASLVVFSQCSGGAKDQTVLNMTVKMVNKECPQMLSSTIRLEGCEVVPDDILRYNYTILNDKSKIDTVEIKNNKALGIQAIKAQSDMKELRDLGVIFQYRYSDKKGKYVCQIEITPEDYK